MDFGFRKINKWKLSINDKKHNRAPKRSLAQAIDILIGQADDREDMGFVHNGNGRLFLAFYFERAGAGEGDWAERQKMISLLNVK